MTSNGPHRRALTSESSEQPRQRGTKVVRHVARKRSRDGEAPSPGSRADAPELVTSSQHKDGEDVRSLLTDTAATPHESTTVPSETAVEHLSSDEYLRRIRRRHQVASGNPLTRRSTDHAAAGAAGAAAAAAVVSVDALQKDPVYRIMHQAHRSDVVEFVKCRFGVEQCNTARRYFDAEFMTMPLRRLRLQLFCAMKARIDLFLPLLSHHRHSLRLVDLSRNKLNGDDVSTLCDALEVHRGGSPLEILDLSYNVDVGNRGAAHLFSRLSTNAFIRAVVLRHVSIDDVGAAMIAPYLKKRLVPSATASEAATRGEPQAAHDAPMCNFFVNLNQNCIGAAGIRALRADLPDHVSLTVLHQHVQRARPEQGCCSTEETELASIQ